MQIHDKTGINLTSKIGSMLPCQFSQSEIRVQLQHLTFKLRAKPGLMSMLDGHGTQDTEENTTNTVH